MWLLVSACDYADTDVGKYQAVTDPKMPLAKCNRAERDEAYTALVKCIKDAFK